MRALGNILGLAACAAALCSVAPAVAADAPVIVYGAAPSIVSAPPTGYVRDPSDARRPIYVVNEGPVVSGLEIDRYATSTIYAVPTYSEGGYAYFDDCPVEAVAPAPRHYPYVRSYYGGRWFTAPPRRRALRSGGSLSRLGQPAIVRPGVYAAYHYRPGPSAKVIQVDPAR
jgi:hypothetical protein